MYMGRKAYHKYYKIFIYKPKYLHKDMGNC